MCAQGLFRASYMHGLLLKRHYAVRSPKHFKEKKHYRLPHIREDGTRVYPMSLLWYLHDEAAMIPYTPNAIPEVALKRGRSS